MTQLRGFFFFHTMQRKGTSELFIILVKLLFQNATAVVNLNGSPKESFNIKCGVRQGCPSVPCMFPFLEEVLTHTIKKACAKGRLRRGTLPRGTKQQTILMYADNSLVIVRGNKQYVDELV